MQSGEGAVTDPCVRTRVSAGDTDGTEWDPGHRSPLACGVWPRQQPPAPVPARPGPGVPLPGSKPPGWRGDPRRMAREHGTETPVRVPKPIDGRRRGRRGSAVVSAAGGLCLEFPNEDEIVPGVWAPSSRAGVCQLPVPPQRSPPGSCPPKFDFKQAQKDFPLSLPGRQP